MVRDGRGLPALEAKDGAIVVGGEFELEFVFALTFEWSSLLLFLLSED